MATFLAYVDAVPGRLYPLVATLLELSRRGHHVIVQGRHQRRRAAAFRRA